MRLLNTRFLSAVGLSAAVFVTSLMPAEAMVPIPVQKPVQATTTNVETVQYRDRRADWRRGYHRRNGYSYYTARAIAATMASGSRWPPSRPAQSSAVRSPTTTPSATAAAMSNGARTGIAPTACRTTPSSRTMARAASAIRPIEASCLKRLVDPLDHA